MDSHALPVEWRSNPYPMSRRTPAAPWATPAPLGVHPLALIVALFLSSPTTRMKLSAAPIAAALCLISLCSLPHSLLAQEASMTTDPGAVIVSEGTLDEYAGNYFTPAAIKLRVWREGERLMLQAEGQQAWPLRAESETVFLVEGLQARVTFGMNAANRVDHLVLYMDGRETKAIRR